MERERIMIRSERYALGGGEKERERLLQDSVKKITNNSNTHQGLPGKEDTSRVT